jgi:hypothetical protein
MIINQNNRKPSWEGMQEITYSRIEKNLYLLDLDLENGIIKNRSK